MTAENRLAELGLELPTPPGAVGVYKPAIVVGNLCYTSGHGPQLIDGGWMKGCVGANADVDTGFEAAQKTGLSILATVRDCLGSLDRVKRVIKILGMVNCVADFEQHPAVINGCSELFREVFGPGAGVGARSAVGMNSLPLDMMVEIEAIFELHD